MPKVVITEETLGLIRENVSFGAVFRGMSEKRDDGMWEVPLSVHTWELLDERRLAGESDDDLVSRVVREAMGKKPS
jgi:hypothetical protein